LLEGQKRDMNQLVRIGTTVEWRWGLEEENKKKRVKITRGDLRMASKKARRR